jgi:VCBS repeat-containing protein
VESLRSRVAVFDESLNSSRRWLHQPLRARSPTPSIVVFIDSTVDDYQTLVNGVIPGARVVLLNPTRDGVEQITETLKERISLSSVHIVSHGSPGCLYLGNTQLSLDTLDYYADRLQAWLADRVLLYGCNVATGEAGTVFVQRLSELTGADIAASTSRTGSAALGGNWEFEVGTSETQVELAFQPQAIAAYNCVMGFNLYDGSTGFTSAFPGASGLGTPGVRQLAYGQFPIFPQSSGAGTPSLNTNLGTGNIGYAGYTNYDPLSVLSSFTLLNPAFPTLDRSTGFSISFNVAVTAETSNPNRAGFSITAIGNDGAGIELGFKDGGVSDRIFAQSADFIEAEFIATTINSSSNYVLTILDNSYTLSNGSQTLTGSLRNYNFDPAASNPPIPFNPYTSPNFLFFGDNTDQGNASFTLGPISTNAFPVATPDNYTTNEDAPLSVNDANVLVNDTDANNDTLIAILETEPTNGTVVLNADGSFTYTPSANFSGIDRFTYRTTDGTDNSNDLATVAIAVNAVADAPTLTVTPASGNPDTAIPLNINTALVDTDGSENLSIQIAGLPSSASLSAGTNIGSGVWQLTLAQLTGLSVTPRVDEDFTLTAIATATEISNGDTASSIADLSVTVNPNQPTPGQPTPGQPTPGQPLALNKTPDDIFSLAGGSGEGQLRFTLGASNRQFVNEIGVCVVDDDQGTIDGLAPGSAGYLQAALSQGKVIFSALSDFPNGFAAANSTRVLRFNSSDAANADSSASRLLFYLVQNSTTDSVLADLALGRTPANVFFALPLGNIDGFDHLQASDQGNETFSLRWEDGLGGGDRNFNDLVLNVQATTEPLALGAQLQGQEQGELIDLRDRVGLVQAQFAVNREAAFENFVGFCKVVNANGGIDLDGNGTVDLLPSDAGYARAAIQQRVPSINLSVADRGTATFTASLEAGFIYMPFLIVDGRPDALLDGNPDNDSTVYFPFLEANFDGIDHLRLLGDNTFGFEDLPGGGDVDYNDLVVQVRYT